MYAVIKTGGKQYKVAAGEKLKIEKAGWRCWQQSSYRQSVDDQ